MEMFRGMEGSALVIAVLKEPTVSAILAFLRDVCVREEKRCHPPLLYVSYDGAEKTTSLRVAFTRWRQQRGREDLSDFPASHQIGLAKTYKELIGIALGTPLEKRVRHPNRHSLLSSVYRGWGMKKLPLAFYAEAIRTTPPLAGKGTKSMTPLCPPQLPLALLFVT